MKKKEDRKRCFGFTLLEVMIVMSLSTVVMAGTIMFLSFMRERWLDASRVNERVVGIHRLHERFIRGGMGRSSGMQGATPILLNADIGNDVTFVYENMGNHYAIIFTDEGHVYERTQQSSTPKKVGHEVGDKRIGNANEQRTVVDATLHAGRLTIDYVMETETFSRLTKTNQFAWTFRAR